MENCVSVDLLLSCLIMAVPLPEALNIDKEEDAGLQSYKCLFKVVQS